MAIPNRPLCHTCQQKTRMYFKIVSDGTRQYRWYCASCERSWSPDGKSGYFIPHRIAESMLSGLSSEQKKEFDAERCLSDERSECFVCGALGAQNHLFAPQSLRKYFGDDFEKYPQLPLCDYHHRLWHETVTWYLPGYRQRMDEFVEKYLKAMTHHA